MSAVHKASCHGHAWSSAEPTIPNSKRIGKTRCAHLNGGYPYTDHLGRTQNRLAEACHAVMNAEPMPVATRSFDRTAAAHKRLPDGNRKLKRMKNRVAKILVVAVFAIGATTAAAEAANCQGRRDTGTAVGAVGGGIVGNAASHGNLGGTIAGAVIGGVAGNLIGGHNCVQREPVRHAERRHRDSRGAAYYYDRNGHRHYYR